jgi:hypothetical protein
MTTCHQEEGKSRDPGGKSHGTVTACHCRAATEARLCSARGRLRAVRGGLRTDGGASGPGAKRPRRAGDRTTPPPVHEPEGASGTGPWEARRDKHSGTDDLAVMRWRTGKLGSEKGSVVVVPPDSRQNGLDANIGRASGCGRVGAPWQGSGPASVGGPFGGPVQAIEGRKRAYPVTGGPLTRGTVPLGGPQWR